MLQRNEGAASEPTLSRHSTQLPLASSAGGRRAHDAAALALDHSSCCRRPRRRRPAWHTLQTPSLCCCSRHPSAFRAAIDATSVSVASTRACVSEMEGGVCGAHRRNDLDHSCRRRASRPCCLAKNRLTCPCQAQNAKNRRRKAARARRAAPTGRQTLPAPQLIVTRALAHAPGRSHRQPGAAWHCHTVDFLKKARSW